MRIIFLLAALLVVGLLVSRSLTTEPSVESHDGGVAGESRTGPEVPRVPSNPQAVPGFEQDINDFVNESTTERFEQIEDQAR